jgi:hypothetical protein
LLYGFVEKWHKETINFHLLIGEMILVTPEADEGAWSGRWCTSFPESEDKAR